MSKTDSSVVRTFGLFEKRIDGDDCLLELARQRFLKAGMGAEMHAATPEHLEWMLGFRPGKDAPVIVHLPREFNLAEPASQKQILNFATRFSDQVSGLVLHDHAAMVARKEDYVAAAWALDEQLDRIEGGPNVFVEYAVGVELEEFIGFFSRIRDLDRISACIDIGHVGIRAARAAYGRTHGGEDVCALKSQGSRLPALIAEVQAAVGLGSSAVLDLIKTLSAFRKPVHFHLHDGHPLSTFSPFGVPDHLSFFSEIPLTFEYLGRWAVDPMFGPFGLEKLVALAVELLGPERLSFTLEIHPTSERLQLADVAALFDHWSDKTNAEKMNHWLAVLSRNHLLLRNAIRSVLPPDVVPSVAEVLPDLDAGPCFI